MDNRIEWPWSLEEEAEWKAQLTQRDEDAVEKLIDDVVGGLPNAFGDILDVIDETSIEKNLTDKYSVTT